MNINVMNQNDLFTIFNLLSQENQKQLTDFALFLFEKKRWETEIKTADHPLKVVEKTWGNIKLSKCTETYC